MAERFPRGPYAVRAENARILAPPDFAARIENMRQTEEGTLRAIEGPCPYVPSYGAEGQPVAGDAPASGSTAVADPLTYGRMHGIFHCRLRGGQRDVLLVHSGKQIWEFEGWNRKYRVLLGTGGQYNENLVDSSRPQWPTQFEATPTGVVIAPATGRAYFYDGRAIAPLGFAETPAAPTLQGPIDLATTAANDGGYAHDRNPDSAWTGSTTQTEMLLGFPRIGTVDAPIADDVHAGQLLDGRWQGAVQWIDRWGNLSPVSPRSNTVEVRRQRSKGTANFTADMFRKEFLWTGIEGGPDNTVGRILYRTPDMLHAGTQKLYEMPLDAAPTATAFATLPDNVTTVFPDNTPDSWLLNEATDIVPVPEFRVCRVAFGRLFIANTTGEPGLVRWSQPGRWGTFARGDEVFPDASGAEVTGLWRAREGVLVFTRTSTYIITPNDQGDGFRSFTLNERIGCVAPSSLGTLPDGRTVWLGEQGFYQWDGQSVQRISDPIGEDLRAFTRGRLQQATAAVDKTGEYRCWIPVEGSTDNNLCFVFDGQAWRRRTDVKAVAVCVTRDERQYMLAAGKVTDSTGTEKNGVWVLDHATSKFKPQRNVAVMETIWLGVEASMDKGSTWEFWLMLREEQKRGLKVEVMRDWRESPVLETHTRTAGDENVLAYPEDDEPAFWDVTSFGAAGAIWIKRRPYWRRVRVYVPSAETVKIRISSPDVLSTETAADVSTLWEFVALTSVGTPKTKRGNASRTPP